MLQPRQPLNVYRSGGLHNSGFQCGFLDNNFKVMDYNSIILMPSFIHNNEDDINLTPMVHVLSNIYQNNKKCWLPSNFRSNTTNFRFFWLRPSYAVYSTCFRYWGAILYAEQPKYYTMQGVSQWIFQSRQSDVLQQPQVSTLEALQRKAR